MGWRSEGGTLAIPRVSRPVKCLKLRFHFFRRIHTLGFRVVEFSMDEDIVGLRPFSMSGLGNTFSVAIALYGSPTNWVGMHCGSMPM